MHLMVAYKIICQFYAYIVLYYLVNLWRSQNVLGSLRFSLPQQICCIWYFIRSLFRSIYSISSFSVLFTFFFLQVLPCPSLFFFPILLICDYLLYFFINLPFISSLSSSFISTPLIFSSFLRHIAYILMWSNAMHACVCVCVIFHWTPLLF